MLTNRPILLKIIRLNMSNNETINDVKKILKDRRQNAGYNTFNSNESIVVAFTVKKSPTVIFESSNPSPAEKPVHKTENDTIDEEEMLLENPYKAYITEISRYSLLKAEDEKILGKKVFNAKLSLRTLQQLNDYLSKILHSCPFTEDVCTTTML